MNNILKYPGPKFKGKFYEGLIRWSLMKEFDSKFYLRLYSNHGRIYAIAQQLPGFTGCSVANGAEEIATLVFKMCQKDFGLKSVDDFVFIKFYPKEANTVWKDEYILTLFDWDGNKFSNPENHWQDYETVMWAIGENPPASLLCDDPFNFSEEEQVSIYALLSKCLKEAPLPDYARNQDLSEFYLFRQDADGYFVFINHKAEFSLYVTMGGELLGFYEGKKS